MAMYKVIQDIEAEDKFVGPLTLKQFIFACAGILFGYLNIFAITKGAPFLMALFLPPMLLGFFLAVPWSRDQPTEMWVLAKLKFLLKSKRRIWDQSGLQELVTITAPKKEEKSLTKNYTQGEVKSRLKALAETIDSRGWAVKHATLEDSQFGGNDFVSDRLVSPPARTETAEEADLEKVPDILDPSSSPLSGNLKSMIKDKTEKQKDELRQKMDQARQTRQDKTSGQSNVSINKHHVQQNNIGAKNMDESNEDLLKQLKRKKKAAGIAQSHMRGIGSSHDEQDFEAAAQIPKKAQAAMTSESTPDTIRRLASSNDLNVATVAREANRGRKDDGEVVIPLR
jgi:hypothetical protein